MEITNKLWGGEPLKIVFHFTGGDATYYTDPSLSETETKSFITEASFTMQEGADGVNPLGVLASSNLDLKVYDQSDNLSPVNTASPYYSELSSGVKANCYLYHDNAWQNYGEWYTTDFSGGFSEGWQDTASVCLEDKLNTVGAKEVVMTVGVYQSQKASLILSDIFIGAGLLTDDFEIDPRIGDKIIPFAVAQGSLVRDSLNSICQLILARVVVDRDGVIHVVPALEPYSYANSIELDASFLGSLSNRNSAAINYNRVKVVYLIANSYKVDTLVSSTQDLTEGTNTIYLDFNTPALSVNKVSFKYANSSLADVAITDMSYQANQKGIEFSIIADHDINDVHLSVTGVAISTTDGEVMKYLESGSLPGGSCFTYKSNQMMTENEAMTILDDLISYIAQIGRQVAISDAALTPILAVGDALSIKGTNTPYDGVYKVTKQNLAFGENYSQNLTLIRVNELEVDE